MSTQDFPFSDYADESAHEAAERQIQLLHEAASHQPNPDDLSPMRGIVIGVILGLMFWMGVWMLFWRLR